MNAEIEVVKRRLEAVYREQLVYLAGKPAAFLEDLQHEAQGLTRAPENLVRVAAIFNQAASESILESRKAGNPINAEAQIHAAQQQSPSLRTLQRRPEFF